MTVINRERHGASNSPTYHTWAMMKQRCYNGKHAAFARYGGRGIQVCERWRKSFSAFVEDMGVRPEGTSLDRIDNDGHYTPDNCRWATIEQQMNNTSRTVRMRLDGDERTLREAAAERGVELAVVRARYYSGWTPEQAVGLEPRHDPRAITINGETLTMAQWAKRNGLSRQAVAQRLARGWSVEDALTKRRLEDGASLLPRRPRVAVTRGEDCHPAMVGKTISRLRVERGWTQAELARRAKVSATSVSVVETGRRPASFRTIYRLAVQLGLRPADLLE